MNAGVYVAVDGNLAGAIMLSDDVKPSAPDALKQLRDLGFKKTVMLSGDSAHAAQHVASICDIDEVYAQLLPEDKLSCMQALCADGKTLYTGDGINDAPVLAAAGAGIAMGGLGSDAAIETADIVIMDDDLRRLPLAVRVARKTRKIAVMNIIASLTVKFAILGLSIFIKLPMYLAIVGDVGMLFLCTLNALRCRKVDRA